MSAPLLPPECDRVLVAAEQIQTRVRELGAELARDLAEVHDVRFVTVLKGGLFFLADLCRATDLPLTIDFLAVSQYTAGVGGMVRVTKDLSDDITGGNVVLVEDMVDTGLTVNYVLSLLAARKPASLRVCALFDKPVRRIAAVPIDYTGFTLPDRFVVGYGLDLGGRYRALDYVATLRDESVLA